MADDIVGITVIGVKLDDSGVSRSLSKIDSDIQRTLAKPRAMPLNVMTKVMGASGIGGGKMQAGTTVPFGGGANATAGAINPTYGILVDIRMFTSLIYQTLEEGALKSKQRIGGKGGGKKNAGLLSRFGIKGMAPYVRAGKGGMYGGVSGIDLMGTLSGMLGKGSGAAAGTGASAGGAAAGASGGAAGGAAAAGMSVPVIGALIAAGLAIYVVLKKVWGAIKESSTFKYLKTMFGGVIGSFLSVIMLFFVAVNNVKNGLSDFLTGLAGPFGIFVAGMQKFIDYFAENSLKETFEDINKRNTIATDGQIEKERQAAQIVYDYAIAGANWQYTKEVEAATWVYDKTIAGAQWQIDKQAEAAMFVRDQTKSGASTILQANKDAAQWIVDINVQAAQWIYDKIVDPLMNLKAGEVMSSVQSTFNNIANTLYNSFVNYFLNPVASVFTSLINAIISGVNKIPGISLSKINVEFDEAEGIPT